jgi:O-acetylserine/cysteine efflux transporter
VKPAHILLALLCAALWGYGFVPSKYGAAHMPPLLFLALRYLLIVGCTIWFVPLPRGHWRTLVFYSLSLGVGHFALLYVGLRLGVEATTASLIWLSQVPLTALLAFFLLGDRPGVRAIVGMAIALAGSASLVAEPRIAGEPVAITLVILSSLMWAVAAIQAKRLPQLSPLALNAWMALISLPILIVLSLVFETHQYHEWLVPDWRLHASLVYMAILSSIAGYGIWFYLLRRHPVSRTAPFLLLVPIIGAISSVATLGDPVTWRTVISGLITLSGVVLIVIRRPAVAAGPPTEP